MSYLHIDFAFPEMDVEGVGGPAVFDLHCSRRRRLSQMMLFVVMDITTAFRPWDAVGDSGSHNNCYVVLWALLVGGLDITCVEANSGKPSGTRA